MILDSRNPQRMTLSYDNGKGVVIEVPQGVSPLHLPNALGATLDTALRTTLDQRPSRSASKTGR